jgi:tetratricopeptide (TPR) repeat protein
MAERAIDFLNPNRDRPLDGLKALRDDGPALAKLGAAYAVTKRNDLAARAWRRALVQQPGNEVILHSLTLLNYWTEGDPAIGLETAEELIDSNPHLAEYRWLHATLLERAGRLPEAIAAAERAIERDPSAAPIRAWLAQAYEKTDQHEKAADQQAILRRWPKASLGEHTPDNALP